MDTKLEIAKNWLPRYTGMPLDQFGEYILITNFKDYVTKFSERFSSQINGEGKAMQASPIVKRRATSLRVLHLTTTPVPCISEKASRRTCFGSFRDLSACAIACASSTI